MNIFILSRDPIQAAAWHCDQHLGKMILESAQMLSTIVHEWPSIPRTYYYKPIHTNHPCTNWLRKSVANLDWLVQLCEALDAERLAARNCDPHASMTVIELFKKDLLSKYSQELSAPKDFCFAGPTSIKIDDRLSIEQKYQAYYRLKNQQWIAEGRGPMTWRGRQIPSFMNQ